MKSLTCLLLDWNDGVNRQGCVSSEGCREKSMTLTSPASKGHQQSLVHGPFLHIQNQKSSISLTIVPLSLLSSDQSKEKCPAFKDPCDDIKPIWIINFTQSKVLHFIISAKFLCHVQWHIYRFWGLGCGEFGGAIILPAIVILRLWAYVILNSGGTHSFFLGLM